MTDTKQKATLRPKGQAEAPPEKLLLRKITIVVEEINDQGHFNIRMEGDCDRIGKVHDHLLSTSEFWAGQLWAQALKMMKALGQIGQAQPPKPTPTLVVP